MAFKDLIPWNWGKREVAVRRDEENPMLALQRDINRAFDNFWRGFNLPMFPDAFGTSLDSSMPRIEVSETDKEVEILAELPGMTENDIDVSVTEDMLKIRGEKKLDKEEKKKDFYITERSYGSFQRMIPLPGGLDLNNVKAAFKNGVLNITLPKTEEAQSKVKRISVRQG